MFLSINNNMNQLISMVENGVTTNFFYDSNGNQIRKEKGIEKWYYTYDFENRLTKVEYFDGTQTLTLGQYYYDGDGKRIKKVESLQTTIYIYQGWNIIYEKESSTNTETKYIYKPDCGCHVGKVVGGTTYFLHVDHLSSVRQETDANGNTVWTSPAMYDPFGELRAGGPMNNDEGHLYTGKLKDTSTGLYYYGARYYDPKIGRLITNDLWSGVKGIPQTLNKYTYVLNNPLTYNDSYGNSPHNPEDPTHTSTAHQGSEVIAADPTNGGHTGGDPYDDGHRTGYGTFIDPDFINRSLVKFNPDGTFAPGSAEPASRLAKQKAKAKGYVEGTQDFNDFVQGFLDGIQKGAHDWNSKPDHSDYDLNYAARGANLPGDFISALKAMSAVGVKAFAELGCNCLIFLGEWAVAACEIIIALSKHFIHPNM